MYMYVDSTVQRVVCCLLHVYICVLIIYVNMYMTEYLYCCSVPCWGQSVWVWPLSPYPSLCSSWHVSCVEVEEPRKLPPQKKVNFYSVQKFCVCLYSYVGLQMECYFVQYCLFIPLITQLQLCIVCTFLLILYIVKESLQYILNVYNYPYTHTLCACDVSYIVLL